MSKKNAIQKLPTKLPILKNPVIHGIKYTDSIYDPEWGFHREQNATDWSTTPNPFRCRMRKNADGTRIVFEVCRIHVENGVLGVHRVALC